MASGYLRCALLYACLSVTVACSPPTPEKLLSDARAAIATGELRTAEIHLKNLLQQRPDDATARVLLGEVSLRSGDLLAAEQNLRRALDLGAAGTAVQLPLLRSLVGQLKFKEALAQIDAGSPPSTDQDRVAVLALQGAALRGTGDRERAEAAYRAALQIDPSSATVRSDLAATLLELARIDEARTLIAAVLADDATFAPALLLRGNLEAGTGQRSAAEATFQQVIDLEREKPALSQNYVLALAQIIEVELALGKLDAAATNADTLLQINPQNPMARYMKAAVQVQQNDLGGAEARLESLIADVPQYWPAHRLLGAINIRQDQLGQAVMYLRTAVTNNPADNAARLQLAQLYIRQGNVAEARSLMDASSANLSDGLFLAFAGRASQQAGLQEQAAQYFDQSEQRPPQDVQQLIGVSNMYMAAGEFDRAIRVLQSTSFADDQSEQMTNYLLTLIQVRQGDLKAADATAQQLQQQQATVAWPLNLRGMIAAQAKDYAGARALLTKALELEPQNVATLLNFARVAAAQNDKAQTEQYLRRVLEIDPAQSIALFGLAAFAAERREFTAAHALLARAPESNERLRAEGGLLAAESRFAEAAAVFAQAFALEPSEGLALRALDAASRAGHPQPEAQLLAWSADHPRDAASNFTLGSVALAKNDRDEAARRYEAVIAVNPNHAPTLNNLAWLYSERGDPRALSFGERALAADPNDPSIADTLGWLYVQSGDVAKGLPLLERAAAALPSQREIGYHWGVALADSGDTAKAVGVLQPLLADGVAFPGRADAEKRLAALRGPKP